MPDEGEGLAIGLHEGAGGPPLGEDQRVLAGIGAELDQLGVPEQAGGKLQFFQEEVAPIRLVPLEFFRGLEVAAGG